MIIRKQQDWFKSLLNNYHNIKKLRLAIILCGHGSRSKRFGSEFKKLLKYVQNYYTNIDCYECFIELNDPLLEDCVREITERYEKIIFVPVFIFKGDHFTNDVTKKIRAINKRIYITNNFGLKEEILERYSNIIKSKLSKKYEKNLIAISSSSKINSVKDDLYNFAKNISNNLNLKSFYTCEYGEEDLVINEIVKKSIKKKQQTFLVPVFLFNGYLYQTIKKKFLNSKIWGLNITRPFFEEKIIKDLLIEKVNSGLKQIN